jgi:hypothetical protein
MKWKERYSAAHYAWQEEKYPTTVRDFGPLATNYPDVNTANGLNRMMINFLTWSGHRATRINVAGRKVGKVYTTVVGNKVDTRKFIKSSTRTGASDVSATINGRSCMFEGKAGRDTPSKAQEREQALERAAGGVYEFVYTPEEFFIIYDKIINKEL